MRAEKKYYVEGEIMKIREPFIPNLERCRRFYLEYGTEMIERRLPRHASRIAVGIVGEGSDCFGYDDVISADHDYDIGFCLWLTEETFQEIGEELEQAYRELLQAHQAGSPGFIGDFSPELRLSRRRGVSTIDGFYRRILGCHVPSADGRPAFSDTLWLSIPEECLAAAVNGAVFRDDEGIFSDIRRYIAAYYPPHVHRLRLADQLHIFSQNGQYNYPRMMARGDLLTARLCVMQAVKSAMAVAYLLNRQYAPYYKWMRRGLEKLPLLSGLCPILDAASSEEHQTEAWTDTRYSPSSINTEDRICLLLEEAAALILKELNRQGFCRGENPFLDLYVNDVMSY